MSPDETSGSLPPTGWYPDPGDQRLDRWWSGSSWTHETRPRLQALSGRVPAHAQGLAGGDAPLATISKREARKVETKIAKQTARSESDARFGPRVAHEAFAGKFIAIYGGGFVTVTALRAGEPQRLISIEATADVGKKSGHGRAIAAGMTLGVNLLGSNKRGDVYLTIATDSQTYALREGPPTAGNMKRSKLLEAVGNAAIRARDSASSAEPAIGGPSIQERLNQLQALLADGLITQGEFDAKRAALLDQL